MKKLQEVVAVFIRQHGVMQTHLGQSRQGAEKQVLDARLGGGRDGDGVAVAAQAGRDPENVDLFQSGRPLGLPAVRDGSLRHPYSSPDANALLGQVDLRRHVAERRRSKSMSCSGFDSVKIASSDLEHLTTAFLPSGDG